jgi:hypothetical protein
MASGKLEKGEAGICTCKYDHSQMASGKLGKSFASAPQDVLINVPRTGSFKENENSVLKTSRRCSRPLNHK